MNRLLLLLVLGLSASCVEGSSDSLLPDDPQTAAENPPLVGGDVATEVDDLGPPEMPQDPDEESADDIAVGEPITLDDPGAADAACIDDDVCPDAAPDGSADDPSLIVASNGQYVPGEKLITLRYTALRKAPRNSARTVGIHSGGGAHGNDHPKGTIPPGQMVVVLDSPRTDGYYRVKYDGVAGWVHRNKVEPWDRSINPVKFARQSTVRNAFFMHQIKRGAWNKDGPLSSGNCAPTSLAMAAKIFRKGGKSKTVEQSIHEARNSYGASSNENDGTSRSEIVRGARRLGLDVQELGTNLSQEAEMDRIDKQLGWNRAVVLEGKPGSAYRSRMTQAFHNGGSSRSYTFAGNHSILVVSKLDSGKYLVADPISEVGMVTMSRSQLKSFFAAWGGTGTAVFDRDWNK